MSHATTAPWPGVDEVTGEALWALCGAANMGPIEALQIVALKGDHSAQVWRVERDGQAIAAIKRAHHNPNKVRAEAAALRAAIPTLGATIPHVLAVDVRHEVRAMALSWIPPGQTLQTHRERASAQTIEALGRWVATCHEIVIARPGDVKLSGDPMPRSQRLVTQASREIATWRRRADPKNQAYQRDSETLASALAWLEGAIAQHTPEIDAPARLIHRDLRAANVIVDEAGNFEGVVDFERACCGDPAWDLVKLRWWLLGAGPAWWGEVLWRGYGGVRALPDARHVAIYEVVEAIGQLCYFWGRHGVYPQQMRDQLSRLLIS